MGRGATTGSRVATTGTNNNRPVHFRNPGAAVRDLLCSRMPAPVLCLADSECPAPWKSNPPRRHGKLPPLVARGGPFRMAFDTASAAQGLQWLAPKAERGTDRCGPY
jgi:hypothetical protein